MIQLKRGPEANRNSIIPADGQPIYTKDKHQLFIGDGISPGGVPLTTSLAENIILKSNDIGNISGIVNIDFSQYPVYSATLSNTTTFSFQNMSNGSIYKLYLTTVTTPQSVALPPGYSSTSLTFTINTDDTCEITIFKNISNYYTISNSLTFRLA